MLKIHPDKRHFTDENGKTVYLIGDTAWEMFHCLSREEAVRYLDCRAQQGFSFIQSVILAEREGLTQPNAYGRLPLKNNAEGVPDPLLPDVGGDYSYFDHVEYIVAEAEKRGDETELLCIYGILEKRRAASAKTPASDIRMMAYIERAIGEEFSVGLGIPRSEVRAYIRSRSDK